MDLNVPMVSNNWMCRFEVSANQACRGVLSAREGLSLVLKCVLYDIIFMIIYWVNESIMVLMIDRGLMLSHQWM